MEGGIIDSSRIVDDFNYAIEKDSLESESQKPIAKILFEKAKKPELTRIVTNRSFHAATFPASKAGS